MLDQIVLRKTLVVSTAHIPKYVSEWLNDAGALEAEHWVGASYPPIPVMTHRYGWLIGIPQDIPDTIPESLAALLNLAREHKCGWLDLDGDGDTLDGLPTFDW